VRQQHGIALTLERPNAIELRFDLAQVLQASANREKGAVRGGFALFVSF
jgi:hypothetical protein